MEGSGFKDDVTLVVVKRTGNALNPFTENHP